MNQKKIILTDNKKNISRLARLKDFLIISLNSQVTSEIINSGIANKENIKDIGDYIEKKFPTYEELYEHYKPIISKELKSRDENLTPDTREIKENLMLDFLQLLAPVEYVKDIVRNICKEEHPTEIKYYIDDENLNFIFSNLIKGII